MKVMLIFIGLIVSMTGYASSLPDFPFVTVTGESMRKVAPDKVTLSFYLTSFEKESNEAKEVLNQSASKVLAILKKHEIPLKNITSYEINKRAKRAKDKNYNDLAIVGYEFTQQFEVIVEQLNKYSEISNALLDVNHLNNIQSQFDSSLRAKIEVELIKEAAEKAKFKSEQMAAGLGVKLGSVFAFNDTGSFSSFFATFGLENQSRTYPMARMKSDSGSASLFIPQHIEITKSINVIYKLKN
ncbi:SIMPL domain-containing protein [Thalassotalea piscium]